METTKQKEIGLEIIAQQLISSGAFKSEQPEEIDQSNLKDVDVGAYTLAKTLTRFFSEKELLTQLEGSSDPVNDALALLVGEAFIRKTEDESQRAQIKAFAKEKNFGAIMDYVKAQSSGQLSNEAVMKMLEERVPEVLNGQAKETNIIDFKFEEYEGQFGKGMRVTGKDMYFEHNQIDKNSILRVTKKGDIFTATYYSKGFGKNNLGYTGLKKILGLSNSLFGTSFDISLEEFLMKIGEKDDRFYRSPSFQFKAKTVNISVIKKDAELILQQISDFERYKRCSINSSPNENVRVERKFFVNSDYLIRDFMESTNDLQKVMDKTGDISKIAKKSTTFQFRKSRLEAIFYFPELVQGITIKFAGSSIGEVYKTAYALTQGINKIS